MKLPSKSKMGFLLVLFPDEDQTTQTPTQTHTPLQETKKTFNLLLKRTNSANLLHKAQSTISICLLLLFTTLLLFTLSALPSSTAVSGAGRRIHRRHLAMIPNGSVSKLPHALQGMGTLYRRGTRPMNELVVAHATDSLSYTDFRLFLRLIYRSGVTSRSDLLFLFPSNTPAFDQLVMQENESFMKLVTQYSGEMSRNRSGSFVETHFGKLGKKDKETGEPIWGRRIKANNNNDSFTTESARRPSYGSVVGFDAEELDPENALSGFLDHVPMSLRRWACYPMLLGRVRRNYKHIMLVDMKEILVLGDQLGRVRNHSPQSVSLMTTNPPLGKHGKRNSDKTQSTRQKPVNPGIIAGGSRGVRRLSNAMLTDIVRAAMQHKKKNSVSESGLLNQLVGNEFVMKNVKVMISGESVGELSSLVGSKSGLGRTNQTVIRRGNGNLDVYSAVMKHICSSFPLDSKVYSDC